MIKINAIFYTTIVLFLLGLQSNVTAQTTPIINISGDSDKAANEKSKYNLEYANMTYTADRTGTENKALKLDGQSFIRVNKSINPTVMPNLTIAFWAKPDSDNKRMTLFSHDNGGYDRTVAIDNRGAKSWKWSAYANTPMAGASINKSKWSFVAVVFNKKENTVLIFVDGQTYKHKGSASKGLDYFHLGNNPTYGEPYIGLLDDIKIYEQSLTKNQLLELFESEGGIKDKSDQYFYKENYNGSDIVVRVGDVDNLGFGWTKGFDPFCGMNTSVHGYPWITDENDHKGTDRIMVVSSHHSGRKDGYTSSTKRPDNLPVSIDITYKKPDIEIEKVVLQLMLDDFQAPKWGTSYQVHINGKRLTYIEDVINKVEQTGPTGKLVQVGLLPEDNALFSTGKVSVKIDDPVTGAGDGYAIDFIQVLINPKGEYECIGNISGIVKDTEGNPLEDVLISANGLKEGLTKANGVFKLENVPIGMITVTANKNLYNQESISFELKKDENKQIEFVLNRKLLESKAFLNEELKAKGFVNLYGIHFDSGKDVPNSQSEATLNELAIFLKSNSELKFKIIGHTDSDGEIKTNNDLSLRRAQHIVNWLEKKGVNTANVTASGLGESSPIASNKTKSGKALNRRVEIKAMKK
ncbi:OmpA family protein [Winogradskyella sp. SM1960]|uniref:OmpA family protein n=1 Tax=Winogradskyella sp. SM1960 TaxID=2865955 RepID=UPI001CD484BA|nr:OmpA family protein [Winogradskyella sp. SM1960]